MPEGSPADSPHQPIRVELERIEEDCTHSGKAHFNASSRWGTYNNWLGLPAVGLSAVASAAFLKSYPDVASAMSGVVTVLIALQTFLKPSERGAIHKKAGDQYLALRNDCRVFRQIRLEMACDDAAAVGGLDEFTKRRNELNAASPHFSRADFEEARRGVDAGQSIHAVDKVK